MTNLDKILDDIEERANAATEGPWEIASDLPKYAVCNHIGDITPTNNRLYRHYQSNHEFGLMKRDADFIAASRTDVPRLVAALRCVLERIKDQRCYCEKQKKSGDLYKPEIICFWHDLAQSLEQIMAGDK